MKAICKASLLFVLRCRRLQSRRSILQNMEDSEKYLARVIAAVYCEFECIQLPLAFAALRLRVKRFPLSLHVSAANFAELATLQ
jgi:hypothetical protein